MVLPGQPDHQHRAQHHRRGDRVGDGGGSASSACIYGLAVLIPGTRRGHPPTARHRQERWWLLLALIPIVGIIVLIVFWATDGTRGRQRLRHVGEVPDARPSERADDGGVALAAAAAERRGAEAAAAAAQLVDEREHDARARHADRVTERDRAAVHVDDVVGDAEVAASTRSPTAANASLSSKRSTSVTCSVALLERALDRARRLREQRRVGAGDHAEADQLGERRRRRAPRPWPCASRRRAAPPSEICDALPAVIVPSFANAGRSPPSDSVVVPGRTPSSVSTTPGRPCAAGSRPASISSAKRPSFFAAAARSWLLAASSSCSSRVMPPTSPRVVLGARAHVHRVERAPQAVVDHRVDDLAVAHAVARTRVRQEVRARWSSTPCRRRRRLRRRRPGSSGRRGRSR